MAGAALAMLWIPLMMLRCLKMFYIDGLINVVDIRSFTDDFSTQAKAQTTVASVIMAVNASILAVPVFTVLSGKDGQTCNHCKYTKFSVSDDVTMVAVLGSEPGNPTPTSHTIPRPPLTF
ncbi:uncharacterized protein EDB93DRAFT_1108608 [Suillus bovinus]|uniref:uncharacterized protein n=1 Tax=Suillus bovinus TaxID=48563 RepID=UPI001B866567|nr:uncharacterized protein EDB93DRAFT_1108608 [Suillus bovinus]KAG2129678.1 hypothetical protein EDB93DRAFT_1108608 [Suillus bovinus]